MATYEKLTAPLQGTAIRFEGGQPVVPNDPIIPFIRGDGTGVDIWPATQKVLDAAVAKAYGGERRIEWFKVYAGDEACDLYGTYQYLPEDTLEAIRTYGDSRSRHWVLIGSAWLDLDRHDEALAAFETAQHMDPDDAGGVVGLASTYLARGQLSDAEDALQEYWAEHKDPEVGVALARFTERSPWRTAFRQVLLAAVSCGATFLIGSAFGTGVG